LEKTILGLKKNLTKTSLEGASVKNRGGLSWGF